MKGPGGGGGEERRWSRGEEGRREAVELLLDLLLVPVIIAIFHIFASFSCLDSSGAASQG